MYLNCHSYYSLRYGTIPIDQLVLDAKSFGVEAMVLTDINAMTGVYDFAKACLKENIKPVVGIEFRNGDELLYYGIARNLEGFRELNEFLTFHLCSKVEFPLIAPAFENCYIVYPFNNAPILLKENELIGVALPDLNKVQFSPLLRYKNQMVIHHPVSIRNKTEFNLHRLLRCVDKNVLLSKLTLDAHGNLNDQFLPIGKLKEAYQKHLFIWDNTIRILDDCNFDFDFDTPKNKETYTGCRQSDRELLEKLVWDGFDARYDTNNKIAKERVKRELDVIENLGFGAYFLCTWDIIRYSLNRGFFHVGRGSGANSIVAYILKITNVCPIELDLYFERFLNPSRKSPPDFDIDWSWKDRDEILDYTFKRFGNERTAFCGTIGDFKHRSIHRELGKVLGLAKEEIDQLSHSPRELHNKNDLVKAIHKYGALLAGFPNMRSMHSCGVFISEKPLTHYMSMFMPPKGFRTAQIDMYIGEEIGFEKLDILSQRGLGTIQSAIHLIKENQGIEIDFNDTALYVDNEESNQMLSNGKTIGCFYVESPAMRGLLRRLRANNYKILVAASSVIRPGVAKSGMLREFQNRHNNPDGFEYFHPVFEKHLGETYGVMVYQEDVIKIAHYFAHLDMADADILRRGMSGKTRSIKELEQVKEKFFSNCEELGYNEDLTKEVYRQIESFAGYSFCKSHSASYAVESYLALYLKTHYPLEFMVCVINNFGGFYRSEVYFHEAKMAGGVIFPPCVNQSEYYTTLHGKEIYVGLIHMEGFNEKVAKEICLERNRNGKFLSLENFIERLPIGMEHLQQLIFVGAFAFTRKPKNELILLARMFSSPKDLSIGKVNKLFSEPAKEFVFPEMTRNQFEDAFDELEIIGFPVSNSLFDLLKTSYRGDTVVSDFLEKEGKKIRIVGYLISRKQVPTVKGDMNFGTWIDHKGDFWDSTHFPDCLKNWPFKGGGVYLIEGKVVVEYGFPSVEVFRMDRLATVPDPRYDDDSGIKSLPKADYSRTHRAPYPSKLEVKQKFGVQKSPT